MAKEYIHKKPNMGIEKTFHKMCRGGEDILERVIIDYFEEKLVPYKGSNVLAFTVGERVNGRPGCYTVVPGFVVNYKYKLTDWGSPVSTVEPITDENKRKELSDV